MKQACIVCYLMTKEGHVIQFGGAGTQEDKKFLAVVMSIRNFTRGIISNLVETEILGGWNYLVGKKERKAIRYFINVQLSH